MYKLSEAAAHDIEQLLDQSILDFGLLQTEAYYHDLTHCLALLADNPEMEIAPKKSAPVTSVFLMRAT